MPLTQRLSPARVVAVLLLALPWVGVAYIWLLPLLRPRDLRGNYLFGYYHLQDIYVGLPLLLLTLAASLSLLAPARLRKPIGHRATALLLGLMVPTACFDLAYSLLYQGALTPIYWLDLQHISRQENLADDELGFKRKPNISWSGGGTETEAHYEYHTDGSGFRNKPAITRAEIAFIGDSYTEAAQVPQQDTFVQLTGHALSRSVINLGRGAYGPQQELIVLERHGLEAQPRIVVWQLFEGNDLADAQEFVIWKENPQRVIQGLMDRYLQNSFFQPFFAITVRSKNKVTVTFSHQSGEQSRMRLRYRWMPRQALTRADGFAETTAALKAGAELCAAKDIRLVVLFIPTQVRVNGHRLTFDSEDERLRFHPDPGGDEATEDFGTKVGEFCASIGVEFIDVYPAFKARALEDSSGLYIPEDEHLHFEGHKLIAKLLVEHLR